MRFIADVMVGKLARYLRMAGYDVLYDNSYTDEEILKIAAEENRIVLSRDSLMFERKEFSSSRISYLFIEDIGLAEQLRQVRDVLKIQIRPRFSRCVECNTKLVPVEKKDVKGKVPPYVFKTHKDFMFCPGCKKYYWKGTHYENILNNMAKML